MKQSKIAILAGDGIGPEVMSQAQRVLEALNLPIETEQGLIGGAAFEVYGEHFPEPTEQLCLESDAVLFGSVGGPVSESENPKWKDCEKNSILQLRQCLDLSVNLRPAKLFPALRNISPIKNERLGDGVDIVIVRELLGDIYFGEHTRTVESGLRQAKDIAEYNENQIKSALHRGFQVAAERTGVLTSVDKANVLETSRLWRELAEEVSQDYPQVQLQHMLVDNCAMQLILNPGQFDTIVTANLFGDILSDAASALPGSLGLMPSASFSDKGFGLYEPSGGSAPEIANKNVANPIAQILSLSLLLQHSLGLATEAQRVESAVIKALSHGFKTADLCSTQEQATGTKEFTTQVIEFL